MGKSSTLSYFFNNIEECNMCNDKNDKHYILGQRLNRSHGLNPRSKTGISTSVMKCRKCGLIYSNPQPVPFDIQDHYGIPPEEYWKPEYFNYDPNYCSSEIQRAKKLIGFKEGMKALDIGAGLGKSMISLKNAGFDTFGFEPSIPFRDKAISKMGIDPDRLRLGKIEDLDYPENEFDFITFGAVLEHLYDPAASIDKAMKWLKPGGVIQIEVPSSRYFLSKLTNFYFKMIGTTYVTNLSPMHEPYHLYEFDLRSFESHSKRNNYDIVFHEYFVCIIYNVPRILHPFFRWYMKTTNTGMQLSIWLQKKQIN
jgi:2-polyprenyl-3-methyl-5-hydroxy-6-metoxy-1,4-benzoquinol methylase